MSTNTTYSKKTPHGYFQEMPFIARTIILLAATLFVLASVSFGFVFSKGQIPDANVFGIGIDKTTIDSEVGVMPSKDDIYMSETPRVRLTSYPERDISTTISDILIRKEEEAKAAAEAARIDEQNHIAQAKNNRARTLGSVGLPPLSEINWDQGKAAFMAEWTGKINSYLAGSPLGGQGETFAAAAWENGIDPRWSPAISNTESTKGANCFAPHNAWGWGGSGWSSWEEAINEHVAGLADKYGYTISVPYAQKYCPPNSEHWYSATLEQMASMG